MRNIFTNFSSFLFLSCNSIILQRVKCGDFFLYLMDDKKNDLVKADIQNLNTMQRDAFCSIYHVYHSEGYSDCRKGAIHHGRHL